MVELSTAQPLSAEPGPLPGFLLTRRWRDGPKGIDVELWFATPAGPAQVQFPGQEVVFFVALQDGGRALAIIGGELYRHRELSLQTFAGEAVLGCYFRSQRALLRARRRLEDAGLAVYEGDIRPVERFLMERFVRGPVAIEGTPIEGVGTLCYRNPALQPTQWQPELSVLSLDIETAVDRLALFSIGVVDGVERLVFMLGEAVDTATVRFFSGEKALLQGFFEWLAERDPDVIIGWNVVNFDCWYLQRVCDRHGLPFALGRGAEVPSWQALNDSGRRRCEVPGRVVLDGIEVIKAAGFRLESYSLQAVSTELLGEGKLLHGQGRGEQIEVLFHSDKIALANYNLQDCLLVWQIFQRHKLLQFCLARSQLTGLALGRVGGSVAAFDFSYLPRLHRRGFVAPRGVPAGSAMASPGGYVLDSRPGIYNDVLVFDFKSLYPSIIRSFCIDPMGLALGDQAADSETVEGFRGARFSRSEHILPELLAELWGARDEARGSQDQALSQAIKILMNSFYGVLGSSGCRFFDPRLASSITLRGHQIIQLSREFIENLGYQVIYGDTDSLFVWLERGGNEQQIRALGQQVASELNQWWHQRLEGEMGLESRLEVEFETHFLRFLMPTIRGTEKGSKKRYAGTVRASPGDTRSPIELVFKGLESVRSDWTPLARQFQQELYRRVFAGEPVKAYVRDMRLALLRGALDQQLIYRKRLRQALGDYEKNVPPQVQAARRAIEAGAPVNEFRRSSTVAYAMTVTGPQAVGYIDQPYDYEHYAQRQLAPVADGILHFIDTSFDAIVDSQIALF